MPESSKQKISVYIIRKEDETKTRIRRMFAGAISALMVLSAVDVAAGGVMNAVDGETTTALAKSICLNHWRVTKWQKEINIVKDGALPS